MRLKEKICLITAAGQGIGRSIALSFAKEGADVLATDINEKTLQTLTEQNPSIKAKCLDVTKKEDISSYIQSLKKIDVLVNCAGYVHHGDILNCSEEDWAFSVNLNVTSMYRMIRAVLPIMLQQGGGGILNMSSAVSSIQGTSNRFVYGTTKAAVIGLTRSIAADYITKRIRCNAICPGTIVTPSLEQRIEARVQKDKKTTAEVRDAFIARQPIGRMGQPEEVAALALYLASDESAFTTGGIHIIDGGWSALH